MLTEQSLDRPGQFLRRLGIRAHCGHLLAEPHRRTETEDGRVSDRALAILAHDGVPVGVLPGARRERAGSAPASSYGGQAQQLLEPSPS